MDPKHLVTAADIADATDQSVEAVARGWHQLAEWQAEIQEGGPSDDVD